MAQSQLDLGKLFQSVLQGLQQNQTALNKADTFNHNHGDNMVQIFDVINQAMKEKKNADPATQLEYASQLLRQKSTSGSADLYSRGLEQASQQIQGQQITIESILPLIMMLLGGGKASPTNTGDLLGSLLGGLSGATGGQSGQGFDLRGLLSVLGGGQAGDTSGIGDIGSLIGTLLGGSPMTSTPHRAQSGEIVAGSILQALSQMLGQ